MDIIARTFDLNLKCTINKFEGNSTDYHAPSIQEDGTIVISPVDPAASFVSFEVADELVALDTTDGDIRTFTLSLTMNAETVTENSEPIVNINEIGQLVIGFDSPEDKFVSVTKNDINEIITEDSELDEPYTEAEVQADLENLTNNWRIEGCLKTNYESEYEDALKILATHYREVEGHKINDNEWVLLFCTPIINEAIESSAFDLTDVLHRFTRGEITIDTLNEVPANGVPVPELSRLNNEAEFYYDPETDVLGYIQRRTV